MRNVKYRGKDIDLNLWKCGRLNIIYNSDNQIVRHKILEETDNIFYTVDSNTISQSLEIKDKYGKEIYEGDILKNDNGVIGFLRWNPIILGFSMIYLNIKKMSPIVPELTKNNSESWVIISNIYDNPSLKLF